MRKNKVLNQNNAPKTYFGITKVTGTLRTKHIYTVKGKNVAESRSNESIQKELEREEAAGLVYDFRGIYPIKRKL